MRRFRPSKICARLLCNDLGTLREKSLTMVSLAETCSSVWKICESRKWCVDSNVRKIYKIWQWKLTMPPDSESSQKTIVLSIRTAFETTSTFYDTQCRNAFCYSKGRGNVIYLKMKSQGKYLELGNKRYCEFEIYMTMTAMIYTLLVTGYLMSWVTEWKTKNTTILVRSLFESTLFQIPRE